MDKTTTFPVALPVNMMKAFSPSSILAILDERYKL